MFLPIGDAPNPRGVPFMTYGIIAVNVAIYLFVNLPLGSQPADTTDPAFAEYVELISEATGRQVSPEDVAGQATAYDLFVLKHGYRPSAPSWLDLLFCMFLHGGFMHLFGNMLFLWIYGDNVERRIGAIPYLFWYLVTGAAGTLSHALIFSSSQIPLVGASGAISGVLGFYFVWFPRNSIRVLMFLPPFLMNVFQIPARWVLGFYLLADNLLPFLVSRGGGVAHGAHIGGFLAGAAVAFVSGLSVFGRRARVDDEPPAQMPGEVPAPRGAPDAIRAAVRGRRYGEAAATYFSLPPAAVRGALTPVDAVNLGAWLRTQGHPTAAVQVLQRAVRDTPRGAGVGEAEALLGISLLEDHHAPVEAYQVLRRALEHDPRPETRDVVYRALSAIEADQKRSVGRLHDPPAWM